MKQMYDGIQELMTGQPEFPISDYEDLTACLDKLDPMLVPSLEGGWRGMIEYWTTGVELAGQVWNDCRERNCGGGLMSTSGWQECNCTNQPGFGMAIWEPCNYASNLAYNALALEVCAQDWAIPAEMVSTVGQTFAIVTFGSAFMHGSETQLGARNDLFSNDLFAYILHQIGVANIPYSSIIHELSPEPLQLSGPVLVTSLLEMYREAPLEGWYDISSELYKSLPRLQLCFCGIFGNILNLLLPPETVDQIITPLMDLFLVKPEEQEFMRNQYLPELRNITADFNLEYSDKISLAENTAGVMIKLVYAFIWQEDTFNLGDLILSPEANAFGAQLLPYINQLGNNLTTWDLQVTSVQDGKGYPGWEWCNPLVPHAKWHLETGASLADVALLMDQVYQLYKV